MNLGEFVQHTSPLNKHYWYFLMPASGPASGSSQEGVGKWRPEAPM